MEEIHSAIFAFINKHHVRPNALYLGQLDFELLRVEAKHYGLKLTDFVSDEIERQEYDGCKIYKVNALHHVHVSFNQIN